MSVSSPTDPPEGWRRGFWPLMATQFQGAFSDNTLKQLVIFLVMAQHLPKARLDQNHRLHFAKGIEHAPRLVAGADLLVLRRGRRALRSLHHPDPPQGALADACRVVRTWDAAL